MNPCFNPDLALNDRPYLQIIEEHQSLAPVMDIQIREQSFSSCKQSELLVVSGSNFSSKINMIRKGISIKDHVCLDQLPTLHSQGGLHCLGNTILMKIVGMESLIVL